LFVKPDPTNPVRKTQHYSTVKAVRDGQDNVLNAFVTSIGVDTEKNGRIDQWNITCSIPKPEAGYILEQANLLVAFDYLGH